MMFSKDFFIELTLHEYYVKIPKIQVKTNLLSKLIPKFFFTIKQYV